MPPVLYLAIPCYNEEAVLPETAKQLNLKFEQLIGSHQIATNSRICFIDDGSKDQTWTLIERFHQENPRFEGIKLSRNRGHQNALLCGLLTLRDFADAVISMDADLQDDLCVIDKMIHEFSNNHCDIVYGVRESRKTDSFFKRFTAQSYYKILEAMDCEVIYNHADCRLMSKRALTALGDYHEVNLYLRGLVPLIGYPSSIVTYPRQKRFAGESKYPLKKMMALAWQGISSLSIKPIAWITKLGMITFVLSLLMLIYFLYRYATGQTVVGWASIAVSVWAIGGLQLLSLGVIGEYVGKMYLETKARPRYVIQTLLHSDETQNHLHNCSSTENNSKI